MLGFRASWFWDLGLEGFRVSGFGVLRPQGANEIPPYWCYRRRAGEKVHSMTTGRITVGTIT